MTDTPVCGRQILEKGHAVCGVFCKRPEGHDGWCAPFAGKPAVPAEAIDGRRTGSRGRRYENAPIESPDSDLRPLGWALYGSASPGATPFAYVASGDTSNPYYEFVASADRAAQEADDE